MEPVSMIVTALATGAVAGLKPTAEQAVKDAYAGLKSLIQRKFSHVDIAPLEAKPDSTAKQASMSEDLADAGADKDGQVLQAAQELIKLIESKAPEAAEAVGITMEQLHVAGSVNIKDIVSAGSGVVLRDSTVDHDLTIEGVVAGRKESSPSNP